MSVNVLILPILEILAELRDERNTEPAVVKPVPAQINPVFDKFNEFEKLPIFEKLPLLLNAFVVVRAVTKRVFPKLTVPEFEKVPIFEKAPKLDN